jgi:hypothetical protein
LWLRKGWIASVQGLGLDKREHLKSVIFRPFVLDEKSVIRGKIKGIKCPFGCLFIGR